MNEKEEEQPTNLESENKALRDRIERLQRLVETQKKARNRAFDMFTGVAVGRPLRESVSKLVDEAALREFNKDTVKEVIYATLKRLTRVGALTLLVTLTPLVLAVLQTYYLKKQNEKLDLQNRRIEQQTYLQEAERRSSLIFLFDEVLGKVDEEMDEKPGGELSAPLVARIVALSNFLKPYRYLEGDSITGRAVSPERGQLLVSLVDSKLHSNTYDKIFLKADFSYSILQNCAFEAAPMRNIRLENAVLQNVQLVGCDLSGCDFTGAKLESVRAFQKSGKTGRGARFDGAKFVRARIVNSDFSASQFDRATFARARMQRVYFQNCYFKSAEFAGIEADSLDFTGAMLLDTEFTPGEIKPWKKTEGAVFDFAEAQLDTITFGSLAVFPLFNSLSKAAEHLRYIISRDTYYIGENNRRLVLEDSFAVFQVLKKSE